MNKKFASSLFIGISILLGIVCGWMESPFFNSAAELISDIFLRLLKLVSLPIVFLAIASTLTGMRDLKEMKVLGRKVLVYTLGTTLIAASIALLLFNLIHPVPKEPLINGGLQSIPEPGGSYLSFALNAIPSNLIQVFLEGNVIGIAFISALMSFAILGLPAEQKKFLHQLFSSLFAAILRITSFIVKLMPVAIFAFIVLLCKDLKQNFGNGQNLFLYLLCVAGANLIQGIIILPLFLKLKGISPLKTVTGMFPALTLAFFSKSSNAALPVTLQSAEKNLGISSKVANFSLPLCSIINMNGCAAFILTTTLFVSGLHGISFSWAEMIGWIFLATIAAIGNAGVPMGCFFLTSAFLVGMNIPLYMMGLILPFYTFLDMLETTLNVWSDATITTVVDKEIKDKEAATSAEEIIINS